MTPVILLHGFTGTPGSWRWVREHLSPREALIPPLLGHNGTEAKHVHSFEGEVERLAAVIRRVGVELPHLVGYSLGARLALGLAVRHPELFSRVTLIGVNPGLEKENERLARRELDERWITLLEEEGLAAFENQWSQQPIFRTQAAITPEKRAAQKSDRMGHSPLGLAESLRVVGLGQMPCYRRALQDLDLPVHLVAGGADAKFRRLAEELEPRLHDGRLTVLPEAGHNLILERPREVARLLDGQT